MKALWISDIRKNSPLSGPFGLQKRSVIQVINGCAVNNINDWNHCLKAMKGISSGFCVPDDIIAENIANEVAFPIIYRIKFYKLLLQCLRAFH